MCGFLESGFSLGREEAAETHVLLPNRTAFLLFGAPLTIFDAPADVTSARLTVAPLTGAPVFFPKSENQRAWNCAAALKSLTR